MPSRWSLAWGMPRGGRQGGGRGPARGQALGPKQRPDRWVEGPGPGSVVGIETGGGSDDVAGKSAAHQQVRGLATEGQVIRGPVAVPAAHQVAGAVEPVAFKAVHRRGDRVAVEAMG